MRVSTRVLSRTPLARQYLLERSNLPADQLCDHLIGLQAQDVLAYLEPGLTPRVEILDVRP